MIRRRVARPLVARRAILRRSKIASRSIVAQFDRVRKLMNAPVINGDLPW